MWAKGHDAQRQTWPPLPTSSVPSSAPEWFRFTDSTPGNCWRNMASVSFFLFFPLSHFPLTLLKTSFILWTLPHRLNLFQNLGPIGPLLPQENIFCWRDGLILLGIIHSKLFIELLLCTKHYCRQWGCSNEPNRPNLHSHGTHILMERERQ